MNYNLELFCISKYYSQTIGIPFEVIDIICKYREKLREEDFKEYHFVRLVIVNIFDELINDLPKSCELSNFSIDKIVEKCVILGRYGSVQIIKNQCEILLSSISDKFIEMFKRTIYWKYIKSIPLNDIKNILCDYLLDDKSIYISNYRGTYAYNRDIPILIYVCYKYYNMNYKEMLDHLHEHAKVDDNIF